MKQLLVLGFYDKGNLGDDMFQETIPLLVPDFKTTFILPDRFLSNKWDINKWDAVICGGGDILNEYFFSNIAKILKNFKGPVYAVGMGIPYPSMFRSNYLSLLDHVFLRETKDLSELSSRIGSQWAHALPDLGFLKKVTPQEKNNRIGIFLAEPILKNNLVFEELVKFCQWLITQGEELEAIRFNTSSTVEDDIIIQKALVEKVPQIINNLEIYNTDQMLMKMASFKMGICVRFHSNIFATIAGLPFVSISLTRKVALFLEEENLSDFVADPKNHLDQIDKFKKVAQNLDGYQTLLKKVSEKNRERLDTLQINNLLLNGDIRLDKKLAINPDEIYGKTRQELFKLTGYDADSGSRNTSMIKYSDARKIASLLCYDLTGVINSRYEWGTWQNIHTKPWELKNMIQWILDDVMKRPIKEKLNFNFYNQELGDGIHRAGWDYVLSHLKTLQNNRGVLCDTFMDRTFIWGRWTLAKKGIIPYTSLWIGFVHHTPNEQFTENNCIEMIKSKEFQQSLPTCQGIICLSEYLADWFKQRVNVPILTLKHPTLFVEDLWKGESLSNTNNKLKLVNVGSWYRNPFSLYAVKASKFIKQRIGSPKNLSPPEHFQVRGGIPNDDNKWTYYMWKWVSKKYPRGPNYVLDSEKGADLLVGKIKKMIKSVEVIPKLSNEDYDKLLAEAVIFLDLVDASAANTVIECIVRNAPICVNPHPAVVEYLGKDYPLYWTDLDKISDLLTIDNIIKAKNYLEAKDKTDLKIETFMDNFVNSEIYKNLFKGVGILE